MQTTNIIDKNWKALIKPNKLEIINNDDKSIAKVVAEPLEKVSDKLLEIHSEEYYYHLFKELQSQRSRLTVFFMSFLQLKA